MYSVCVLQCTHTILAGPTELTHGSFYSFANANVLLVLGELMSVGEEEDTPRRGAIPLIAGAIVTAQITMALSTYAGDRLTRGGVGRKPLFMAGLLTLPIRCALIILWKDSGDAFLLATQVCAIATLRELWLSRRMLEISY
jgi:MFS family permease